ncbi:MAG: 4Fe-4S binding protein [Oscillospiraceae bacterium]|nr:4Fe-4S binding protein [Oscillospiraceae bacterium]
MNAGTLYSWRKVRPCIRHEKCTGCGDCMSVCPFEAIYAEFGQYRIRNELCRGCGICALDCLRRAIFMELPKGEPEFTSV